MAESSSWQRLAGVLERLGAEVDGAEDFDKGELPDPLDPAVLELGGTGF